MGIRTGVNSSLYLGLVWLCGCSGATATADTNSLEGFVQLATLGDISGASSGGVTVSVLDANLWLGNPNSAPVQKSTVQLGSCLSTGGCEWDVPALAQSTFSAGLIGAVTGDGNWLTSYTLAASSSQFATAHGKGVPVAPAFAFAVPSTILPVVASLTGVSTAELMQRGFGLGLVRQVTQAGAMHETPTPVQGIAVTTTATDWTVYYPTLDGNALAGTQETTSGGIFLVVPQSAGGNGALSTWSMQAVNGSQQQSAGDQNVPAVGIYPGAVSVIALSYE